MRRLILPGTLLLLTLAVAPAYAQNNCLAWECVLPPPYTCAYCDISFFNNPAACAVSYTFPDWCFTGGYCDTGNGDECPQTCVQNPWTRWNTPRGLREEWSLVRVKVRKQAPRHKQS